MEVVRDVKSFVAKNGDQLQKFFIYKTGIIDRELIHEHLQDFYVKMIQTRALESYREDEGSFDSYISTLLCWMLPYKAKKNVSVHFDFITKVQRPGQLPREADDIWEYMGTFEGPYKVDFSPCTPRIFDNTDEELFQQYLNEFKEYITKTESPINVRRMLIFLECRQEGCNSAEIAVYLGLSDNMVKIIKQRLLEKFELWKILN
jgi:hypothetical protein